jgi:hypothetical protein
MPSSRSSSPSPPHHARRRNRHSPPTYSYYSDTASSSPPCVGSDDDRPRSRTRSGWPVHSRNPSFPYLARGISPARSPPVLSPIRARSPTTSERAEREDLDRLDLINGHLGTRSDGNVEDRVPSHNDGREYLRYNNNSPTSSHIHRHRETSSNSSDSAPYGPSRGSLANTGHIYQDPEEVAAIELARERSTALTIARGRDPRNGFTTLYGLEETLPLITGNSLSDDDERTYYDRSR